MEMTQEQARMLQETHDEVVRIGPILDRLQKFTDGNGQPGIDARLTTVETQRANCPARNAFLHGHRQTDKALRIAVGSAVINGIGVVAAIVFYALRVG